METCIPCLALPPSQTPDTDDARSSTGLAHLLEHMTFKGTTRIGSVNVKKEQVLLDSLDEGAHMSAAQDVDWCCDRAQQGGAAASHG